MDIKNIAKQIWQLERSNKSEADKEAQQFKLMEHLTFDEIMQIDEYIQNNFVKG